LPEAFDYEAPENMELAPGDFVKVPLAKSEKLGIVTAIRNEDSPPKPLKPILQKIETTPLSADVLAFIEWAAKYLVVPQGVILHQILRAPDALFQGPFTTKIVKGAGIIEKATAARAAIMQLVNSPDYSPLSKSQLAQSASSSVAVVSGMVKIGALTEILLPVDLPFKPPRFSQEPRALNLAQKASLEVISGAIDEGKFKPFLLDGVTGSGKTEVYLEAIAHALLQDDSSQILVLLAEIALTQAVIARISDRFDTEPTLWHSEISASQKRRAWREIASGRARIVIGARSAIFLPFQKLRLLIVDEEHDASYKQEDGLRYQARDLAVVRAKFANAVLVLASATPSLETRNNALSGRYGHLVLVSRFGTASLPNIELIDLKAYPPEANHWISPLLVEEIATTLHHKEQVLLFLNRRGFAPVVLCGKCGHKMTSPNTDSWLVEHRYSNRLVCHLTGYSIPKPLNCPSCHSYDSLVSVGPGVERVAKEVQQLFPSARVEVFSSDTSSGPQAIRQMVERMEGGEIDIMVGTQIAAKGHNFPLLTLVGVIDGDLSLKGGDPRAGERTYQLLTQVAGRAGRAGKSGRAMIQTYFPDNEAMQALLNDNRESFLDIETQMRAVAKMPPFGRLAALQLMAKTDEAVDEAAQIVSNALFPAHGIEVWGPASPPLALIRGWRRRRFLVRADKNVDISAFMAEWRKAIKIAASVRLIIDIEPYSFM
jgi:primosomal protein N' (replication factor Y)